MSDKKNSGESSGKGGSTRHPGLDENEYEGLGDPKSGTGKKDK